MHTLKHTISKKFLIDPLPKKLFIVSYMHVKMVTCIYTWYSSNRSKMYGKSWLFVTNEKGETHTRSVGRNDFWWLIDNQNQNNNNKKTSRKCANQSHISRQFCSPCLACFRNVRLWAHCVRGETHICTQKSVSHSYPMKNRERERDLCVSFFESTK